MQKYPSHWFEPHELRIIHGEIRGTETSSPSHGRRAAACRITVVPRILYALQMVPFPLESEDRDVLSKPFVTFLLKR